MASKRSDKLLVCAIDFGTTYSGYAFSLRDKPTEIQTPQTWFAGNAQLASLKAPTCLLIQSDGKRMFGYEAENTYADLTENDDHHDCYFFQHFKKMLHNNNKLSKSTTLEDISGKPMQALKIFTYSMEFFKNHLMETLHTRGTGLNLKDIQFVITVPAIWNDSAKQFMREAAVKAGLKNEQISFALEPEVASVFCQQATIEKMATPTQLEVEKAGTEYMVVDLGGGTVDITVHRKEVDDSLNALYPPTGGPWGGNMVNNEFLKEITELVGNNVMTEFKKVEMGDYFDLIRTFESKKRTITYEKEGSLVIRIPASLRAIYEKQPKKTVLEEAVDSSKYKKHISISRDRLKIDMAFIKQLFEPSVTFILNHVKKLLQQHKMKNVNLILLVGGYAECPLVHRSFLDTFGEKRVVIPHEAGLGVIKGAVNFGHNPLVISSRVLKYTYGTDSTPPFKEGIDPDEKKFIDKAGKRRCSDVFVAFKRSGDRVEIGEIVSRNQIPIRKEQPNIQFKVFVTTDSNPNFTTDEGCKELSTFCIDLPRYTGKDRKIVCDFVFGQTEFMIEVTENITNKRERKYFDLPE